MRKTSFLLFLAASTTIAQNPCQKENGRLMSLSATTRSGIRFCYAVESQPPRRDLVGMNGVATTDSGPVHRWLIDKVHRRFFGYDISAERGSSPGQYRVTIAPLTLRPEELPEQFQLKPRTALSPVFLPKYPEAQIVNDGDIIALDLLVSPDGQQKVVDYIEVRERPEPPAPTSTGTPKDFTPDDGPVNIDFDDAKVWVNGQKYPGSTSFDTMPGATVTFYFPGQGRYILSLVPHQGFTKTGAVRDNVFSFEADGQRYEVRTMHLILSSKGSWNLYVLHDPSYVPDIDSSSVQVGTNRLENLVTKR